MVFTLRQRRWAALACVLGLFVWSGCDDGPKKLAKAEAQYWDLIDRGVPPRDPAWEAVVAAFEAVPKGSKARPDAERRLEWLKTLRQGLPQKPLATPGASGAGTDAQRAECERLARELGVSTGARREEVSRALGVCMKQLIQLQASAHPPGEGGHEHGTDGGT